MNMSSILGKIAVYFLMPFAGSAIGALVGVLGPTLGYFNKDRELDIEMVRVSLSILAGENQDTSTPGRKFALRSLARYSDVAIPDEEFEEWAQRGTIPKSLSESLGFCVESNEGRVTCKQTLLRSLGTPNVSTNTSTANTAN